MSWSTPLRNASTPCGSSVTTKHNTTATSIDVGGCHDDGAGVAMATRAVTSIEVVRLYSPAFSDSSRRPFIFSMRRRWSARRMATMRSALSTVSRTHGTTYAQRRRPQINSCNYHFKETTTATPTAIRIIPKKIQKLKISRPIHGVAIMSFCLQYLPLSSWSE